MINKEILGMKIYTIDDEKYNTFLIEQLLEEVGFDNTMQFNKGADLFEQLENEELPDLIISDILMPKLSGYDLIKKVKSNPDWKHIPIIIITAVSVDVTDHLK
ncbi:MAG: response regulator, partial [Candidatus Cloacimonadota bacterium]|nr:response regulator [Candidatus Cloacimonadota bacterium]